LDATFPNRWIDRDGPTPWPARSPDITLLEFVLWGYVRDKIPDITNLKARTTDALVQYLKTCWRTRGEKLIID